MDLLQYEIYAVVLMAAVVLLTRLCWQSRRQQNDPGYHMPSEVDYYFWNH